MHFYENKSGSVGPHDNSKIIIGEEEEIKERKIYLFFVKIQKGKYMCFQS